MLQRQAAVHCLPVMLPLLSSHQTTSHQEGKLLVHCQAFPPASLPQVQTQTSGPASSS